MVRSSIKDKFFSFKQSLAHNLINIPGWHTNRKILVIESDDWGSIRMPSRDIYDQFIKRGIKVDNDPYCRFDSLASSEDLEALFEVLGSVKDKNGKPAMLTVNTVTANPNFEKIKESNFSNYFHECFTETLKRYKSTEGSFEIWQQGMNSGVFHPQFHGREHLNVKKWMRDLQQGNPVTHLAFELGTFGLTQDVDTRIRGDYMGAFNSGLQEDILYYNSILKEGLGMFEDIFKYKSTSFIPTTYTWPNNIEPDLKKNGVKYLQGNTHQRIPLDDDTTFKYKKNNFTGLRSKSGLLYISRNAYFEPSQNPNFDWVNNCLKRIEIGFRWGKPAIICSHRLNFIGSITIKNRETNLELFSDLLTRICSKYPDVEFMSSDELGKYIDRKTNL